MRYAPLPMPRRPSSWRSTRRRRPAVGFEAPTPARVRDYATNVAFSLAKAAHRAPQRASARARHRDRPPRSGARLVVQRHRSRRGIHQPPPRARDLARVDLAHPARGRAFRRSAAQRLAHLVGVRQRQSEPGRSSSFRAARCRSAQRSPTRCACMVTTSSSSGSSTMPADSSTHWGVRSTRGIASFPSPLFPDARGRLSRGLRDPHRARVSTIATATAGGAPKSRSGCPTFRSSAATNSSPTNSERPARFGVIYDRWQSESELHEAGKLREGVDRLRELGLTYESDGALFFRATNFSDDKDRVLLRGDGRGRPTFAWTSPTTTKSSRPAIAS